jgi:hypothetical protein
MKLLTHSGVPGSRSLLPLLLLSALSSRVQAQVRISGQVLDGGGSGIDNVVVTLHMSDGKQPTTTTKHGGKYDFPNLTTKGKVLWIEFTKLGTGRKELDDLSEKTGQGISIVLGKTPTTVSAIQARQVEIDRLLFRARFSPKEMSDAAKAYLKSDAFDAEIKALPTLNVEMPREARDALRRRAGEQLQHLVIARNQGEGKREREPYVTLPERIITEERAIRLLLLWQSSVQKDLKLIDEQVSKINQYARGQWREAEEVARLPEKEREEKFAAMAKENDKFIAYTLAPEQRKRLNQIAMDVALLLGVTPPHLAKELQMTDEQKSRFHELQKAAHKEAVDVLRSSGGQMIKQEKLKEMRLANRWRLMDLLTAEQKTKWRELDGEPFTGDLYFGPPR